MPPSEQERSREEPLVQPSSPGSEAEPLVAPGASPPASPAPVSGAPASSAAGSGAATSGAASSPAASSPAASPTAAARERTRTKVAFNSLLLGAVVLILLLVFILENTANVKISYFGATGSIPLGVALLLAAVGGALLVGLVGSARIFQLRRRMKRTR